MNKAPVIQQRRTKSTGSVWLPPALAGVSAPCEVPVEVAPDVALDKALFVTAFVTSPPRAALERTADETAARGLLGLTLLLTLALDNTCVLDLPLLLTFALDKTCVLDLNGVTTALDITTACPIFPFLLSIQCVTRYLDCLVLQGSQFAHPFCVS